MEEAFTCSCNAKETQTLKAHLFLLAYTHIQTQTQKVKSTGGKTREEAQKMLKEALEEKEL